MNDVWKRIFREFIESYDAIQVLEKNDLFDEEAKLVHEHSLLFNIIETMKTEIEN